MFYCSLAKIVDEANTRTVISTGSTFKSVGQLILVIVIFLLVLAATFFVTRWIGNYHKTKTGQGNLQVVEAIRLPSNKYIELVRVGKDRYIVVGVGKDEINLLTEVDSNELVTSGGGMPNQIKVPQKSFSQIIGGFKDSLSKKNDD